MEITSGGRESAGKYQTYAMMSNTGFAVLHSSRYSNGTHLAGLPNKPTFAHFNDRSGAGPSLHRGRSFSALLENAEARKRN